MTYAQLAVTGRKQHAGACVRARLKLLPLWADPLNRLLTGTRFAFIQLVLTGSRLLLARAIARELFLASFSFPHSFYVSFAESFCWVLFCFFNVNFKVKFQGEELKSTEPAQALISLLLGSFCTLFSP